MTEPTALEVAQEKRALAEAEKFAAEAARNRFEVLTAENINKASALELAQKEYEFDKWTRRRTDRTIYMLGEVTELSVSRAMDSFTDYATIDPGCDITFIINSPGGIITDGMALFDHIQIIKRQGHKVTTRALGEAASMGGVLLQAGTVRQMSKEAWLMLHEAAFGARGKTAQVEDQVDLVKRIQDRILDIYASRSNMTKAQIRNKWTRRDWYLSSEEALKAGFIDEVV